ncbi:hypothetical protein BV898_05117 [Hypsibius exemplaris]|uniref:Odorant receptor n=1 Tax=Hypsibius exemplaris TaxID=2072580 RepID=A0A1W0X0R0_HYPEX|nr:hypothetical protein BV898_05117 [Hypsibius exemplaris]
MRKSKKSSTVTPHHHRQVSLEMDGRRASNKLPSFSQSEPPFPANILLRLFGRRDPNSTSTPTPTITTYSKIRLRFFYLYMAVIFIWLLVFSISTFYQSSEKHAKASAQGAQDSSIIIAILDDVSWVSIMLRNCIILTKFVRHAERFYAVTAQFDRLFCLVRDDHGSRKRHNPQRYAAKLFLVSCAAVVVSSMLCITYWNTFNYSQFYSSWSLQPFPVTLTYWNVSLFMILFAFVPFIMAQAILASIVGLGAGVLDLMTFVNGELEKLTETTQDMENLASETDVDGDGGSSLGGTSSSRKTFSVCSDRAEKNLATLRWAHFQLCRFVDELSESFSDVLMVALLFDVISALGFVGLIIGYKSNFLQDPTFDRVYQSLVFSLWSLFFLCASYWPLIRLHEEGEMTYHWVQALSLTDGSRFYHREMTHFLMATKNVSVGVVAGKLFVFSRNLCATIISLLCSFGLILYEILHKDKSGGLLAVLEARILPASINASLNEESTLLSLAEAGNVTKTLSAGRHAAPAQLELDVSH